MDEHWWEKFHHRNTVKALLSEKLLMEVPQHIYVAGGPNDDGPNPATTAQKKRALASEAGMVVPGRITVGGGDTHHGGRSQPVEVLANNQLLATPLSVDVRVPSLVLLSNMCQV